MIGFDWGNEQTVQLEGTAAVIPRDDLAVAAYYKQFPTRRERAAWPDMAYVRVPGSLVIPGPGHSQRPASHRVRDAVLVLLGGDQRGHRYTPSRP
jgi:hypothetical protein